MSDLKLVALDAEDLKVISSCCQDALMRVGDLEYLRSDARFVLAMNRFVWEAEGDKGAGHERTRSVLHFERVRNVKVSGINRAEKDIILSLLAVMFEPAEEPGGIVELVFAGDGAIRLEVECVEAQLADMPARWSAKSVPTHDRDS